MYGSGKYNISMLTVVSSLFRAVEPAAVRTGHSSSRETFACQPAISNKRRYSLQLGVLRDVRTATDLPGKAFATAGAYADGTAEAF